MILLALACAVEPVPEVTEGVVVTDATVTLAGGARIWLAQAVLAADGSGTGSTVSAHVPADPPPLDISAARSNWNLADRVVRFDGQVVATRADVRLECDSLVVHYEGPDRVKWVEADGAVRVTRGQRTASSEHAVLTTATGKVELTGQPQLFEGPNRMTGVRIVLWLDDEKVDCEDCRLVVEGPSVAPTR